MDKQKITNFLKTLCPIGKIEFNDLVSTYSFDNALNLKTNVYFLASVEDKNKRNWDKDIIFKNYFYVDFDLRESYQKLFETIITDEELDILLDTIKTKLKSNGFWDWRYIVNTGNWFHFYYVWEWQSFWVEEYKDAVEYYYSDIDSIFNDPLFKTDHACKNIWRIARLPWTINYAREKKFSLELKEAIIIEETDIISDKIKNIPVISKQQKELDTKDTIKRQMNTLSDDTLEAILEIDIIPLVEEYTGLKIAKDNKNFPDKNWNTWMFVADNILFWTGTGRISDRFAGYNTFTFIKEHYKLDNNWTFQRFKDRYNHIKDISNIKKKEFKSIEEAKPEDDIRIQKDTIWRKFDWLKPSRWLDYIDKWFRKMDEWWELVVMFWPPWCWKTELWFFIAKANINMKTICFCLEIPEDTILKRRALRKNWLSREDVDYNNIDDGRKNMLISTINNFKNTTSKYLQMISIKETPTIEQLIYKIDKERKWQEIIIIDNLGKIKWVEDENRRFEDITNKLQTYAYNNKCRILLQHHTVKPAGNKQDKDIDDIFDTALFWPYGFRWSQKIYDNCTRLIEIHRNYWNNTTKLLQYKHTPTDTRWYVDLEFVKWDYIKYEKPF